MKKILLIIGLTACLIIAQTDLISADSPVAGESASLYSEQPTMSFEAEILREYLAKHNSPLTDYSEYFILVANKNNLDWRLLPAISGVESTYGKHIPLQSYNAYGWANGDYRFDSWEESIDIVAQTLRDKYLDRGYVSINQIGRIYAPPSSTWAGKVKYIMNKIYPLPLVYSL